MPQTCIEDMWIDMSFGRYIGLFCLVVKVYFVKFLSLVDRLLSYLTAEGP